MSDIKLSVVIPSYRDPLMVKTVGSLLTTSELGDKLEVLVQRSDENTPTSLRAKGNLPRKSNPPKECQVYIANLDFHGNLVRTSIVEFNRRAKLMLEGEEE